MAKTGPTFYDRSWLIKARKEQGYKQTDIADAVGTTAGNYNRIESGASEPGVKTGLRIAYFLHLNPSVWISEKPLVPMD